eukprot:m51a1_g5935 hypothetical protein (474) ;mRNA; f:99951-101939
MEVLAQQRSFGHAPVVPRDEVIPFKCIRWPGGRPQRRTITVDFECNEGIYAYVDEVPQGVHPVVRVGHCRSEATKAGSRKVSKSVRVYEVLHGEQLTWIHEALATFPATPEQMREAGIAPPPATSASSSPSPTAPRPSAATSPTTTPSPVCADASVPARWAWVQAQAQAQMDSARQQARYVPPAQQVPLPAPPVWSLVASALSMKPCLQSAMPQMPQMQQMPQMPGGQPLAVGMSPYVASTPAVVVPVPRVSAPVYPPATAAAAARPVLPPLPFSLDAVQQLFPSAAPMQAPRTREGLGLFDSVAPPTPKRQRTAAATSHGAAEASMRFASALARGTAQPQVSALVVLLREMFPSDVAAATEASRLACCASHSEVLSFVGSHLHNPAALNALRAGRVHAELVSTWRSTTAAGREQTRARVAALVEELVRTTRAVKEAVPAGYAEGVEELGRRWQVHFASLSLSLIDALDTILQ